MLGNLPSLLWPLDVMLDVCRHLRYSHSWLRWCNLKTIVKWISCKLFFFKLVVMMVVMRLVGVKKKIANLIKNFCGENDMENGKEMKGEFGGYMRDVKMVVLSCMSVIILTYESHFENLFCWGRYYMLIIYLRSMNLFLLHLLFAIFLRWVLILNCKCFLL